ncbi:MAG: hypothetical protein ACREEP_12210 [Dongiaceae bacterium]
MTGATMKAITKGRRTVCALIGVLALAGCANMSNTEQRMLSGGAIGAAAGAATGAIVGGLTMGTGAALGGVLGIGAGYVIDKADDD